MLFQFCLNLAREKQNVALNIVVMIVNKIKIDVVVVVVVEGREDSEPKQNCKVIYYQHQSYGPFKLKRREGRLWAF